MKEDIKFVGIILGGLFVTVLFFGSFIFLLIKITECPEADFYMLEVNNGPDIPMGFDYEKAKELNKSGQLYVVSGCKNQ